MSTKLYPNQSDELTDFFNTYIQWIKEGAQKESNIFSRRYGLCKTVRNYEDFFHLPKDLISKELKFCFKKAGLNTYLPFNKGDFTDYNTEAINYECHLNHKRLAFVINHSTFYDDYTPQDLIDIMENSQRLLVKNYINSMEF